VVLGAGFTPVSGAAAGQLDTAMAALSEIPESAIKFSFVDIAD
jgi:hypothetical protein